MVVPYKINVFEKTDSHPDREGVGLRKLSDVDPEFRLFVKQLSTIAQTNGVQPEVRVFKWPTPDYKYLHSDGYISDVGVLFTESLDQVGLELAHLIHGSRYPLHVLVVTRKPINNEHTEETKAGLNAISRDVIELTQEPLVAPRMESPYTYDAEKLGHIQYFDMPSMSSLGTRKRLHKLMLT